MQVDGDGSPTESEASPNAKLIRVANLAARCHELRDELGEEAATEVFKRASSGDDNATKQVGFSVSESEFQEALQRVTADLALTGLDPRDSQELSASCSRSSSKQRSGSKPLSKLPVRPDQFRSFSLEVAEALRWFVWHQAWYIAETESSFKGAAPGMGPASTEQRRQALDRYRSEWREQAAAARTPGGGAQLDSELIEAIVSATQALAEHATAWSSQPKEAHLAKAKESWLRYEKCFEVVTESTVLYEDLIESIRWLLYNAALHASKILPILQNNGMEEDDGDGKEEDEEEEEEDDDDEDEDKKIFGEEYPGFSQDALTSSANFLRHVAECRGGMSPRWRGLCLSEPEWAAIASASIQQTVHAATKAGFNAIRVPVPERNVSAASAHGSLDVFLEACKAAGCQAFLDLSAWSFGPDLSMRVEACLSQLPKQLLLSVAGVALPACVPLAKVEPLVLALRAAGLSAGRCAAIVRCHQDVVDDDEEYVGDFRNMLVNSQESILLKDGHVVLEVERPALEPKDSHYMILDEVAQSWGGAEDWLPQGSVFMSLTGELIDGLFKKDHKIVEELALRFEASMEDGTFGWFVELSAAGLKACVEDKLWGWPDEDADSVFQPFDGNHTHTFVFLHGFTCHSRAYVASPQWFEKKLVTKAKRKKKKRKSKSADDEDVRYAPFPGLKVVMPTAPLRPITCFENDPKRAWYDYLEDHDGEAEDDLDEATLMETVVRIHGILDKEIETVGAENVFLGGSSQGCCTALHIACTYLRKFGGIYAGQGHLLTRTPVDHFVSLGVPVRVYHGLDDTTMPWAEWVSPTYERLRKCDYREVLDEGVEHGDDKEGEWIQDFLAEMLEKRAAAA